MDRVLTTIEEIIMVVFIGVAFACGAMQVVLRYAFNTGFPWSEGILITAAVWAALMAGSRAVREGLHVRVEVFADNLRPWARRAAAVTVELVSIVFVGTLAYSGYLYTRFVWMLNAVSQEAYIAEWLIYGVVPVSMGFFALRHLQRLWLLLTGAAGETDEDLDRKMARSL